MRCLHNLRCVHPEYMLQTRSRLTIFGCKLHKYRLSNQGSRSIARTSNAVSFRPDGNHTPIPNWLCHPSSIRFLHFPCLPRCLRATLSDREAKQCIYCVLLTIRNEDLGHDGSWAIPKSSPTRVGAGTDAQVNSTKDQLQQTHCLGNIIMERRGDTVHANSNSNVIRTGILLLGPS